MYIYSVCVLKKKITQTELVKSVNLETLHNDSTYEITVYSGI